jgi:hypothetical protein
MTPYSRRKTSRCSALSVTMRSLREQTALDLDTLLHHFVAPAPRGTVRVERVHVRNGEGARKLLAEPAGEPVVRRDQIVIRVNPKAAVPLALVSPLLSCKIRLNERLMRLLPLIRFSILDVSGKGAFDRRQIRTEV